jgi:Exonuclease I
VAVERKAAQLRALGPALAEKVRCVFAQPRLDEGTPNDADASIYDGFLAEGDRALMPKVRTAPPEALAAMEASFRDPRLPELLFRYRARNHPHTLTEDRARPLAGIPPPSPAGRGPGRAEPAGLLRPDRRTPYHPRRRRRQARPARCARRVGQATGIDPVSSYFTPASLQFLSQLAANNNKAWFNEHKAPTNSMCASRSCS